MSPNPLAQLLHALNQPLTGLQCAMEVALAAPRTPEQYAEGLRAGLHLTGRMRVLVEAIREVVDAEEQNEENQTNQNKAELETTDWQTLLREVLDDLGPVAEGNGIRITLDGSAESSLCALRRGTLSGLLFRTLESALSLAERGSWLRIEMGPAANRTGFRICWQQETEMKPPEFSRPELGLLVAQATWERAGAKWDRERRGNLESVMVKLPRVSSVSMVNRSL